jgi:inosine/xanthosine triphosphatase
MKTITIAVGSTRVPKLNGVWEAIAVIGPTLDPSAQFKVVGEDVPSGVGHTPVSRAESMAGARNRAEALVQMARRNNKNWSYFVGLEGGLDVIFDNGRKMVLLESWAYVTDGSGAGAFGRSGGIEMPEKLAAEVLDRGIELSEAVDALAGGRGLRNAQGAWGVLTKNLMTRQDAFRTAVTEAFARFFNPTIYRDT